MYPIFISKQKIKVIHIYKYKILPLLGHIYDIKCEQPLQF